MTTATSKETAQLAFELILQPSSLEDKLLNPNRGHDKLPSKVPDVVSGVLTDFLQQMHADNKPESSSEVNQRRKASIQMMALQIAASFNWNLDWIQENLALNLQLQLLDTLLISCLKNDKKSDDLFSPMMSASPSTEQEKAFDDLVAKNGSGGKFATSLYFRWVVRSLPRIHLPLPPLTKHQIYASGGLSGCNFVSVNDPNIGVQVTNHIPLALQRLEAAKAVDEGLTQVPSQSAFKIGPKMDPLDDQPMVNLNGHTLFAAQCSSDEKYWKKMDKGGWTAMVLFDLAAYYFYVENYSDCRRCLELLKAIDENVVKLYVEQSVLDGYYKAVLTESSQEQDEAKAVLDEMDKKKTTVPYCRRIKAELSAWFKGQTPLSEKLTEKNVDLKLKCGFPQNFEFFRLEPDTANRLDGDNVKENRTLVQYLSGFKKIDYDKNNCQIPNDKMWNKIKHPKLKKRDLVLALLRENRPEKIVKILQDLTKLNMPIRRMISRWTSHDSTKIANLLSQSNDANYVFVLMAKLQQFLLMGYFNDTKPFFIGMERQFGLDKQAQQQQRYQQAIVQLRLQNAIIQMSKYGKDHTTADRDLYVQTRACLDQILEAGLSEQFSVLEQAYVTLLNLGDFEFVLSKCKDKQQMNAKRRNLIHFAGLLSAAVPHIHGRVSPGTGQDFKKTCRGLADFLLPTVQSNPSAKRSREITSKNEMSSSETKNFIAKFILKLDHPEVLTLLGGFFVSIYNSAVEDSSHEIHSELPVLPVSANSSSNATNGINEDAVLGTVTKLANKGKELETRLQSPWLRVLAEVNFAQANYSTAIQHFVQALILTTNYFTKPWATNIIDPASGWDERIFHKMIKCASELGHHATTVVLCQFVSDSDYPTAFRSMEDRCSNDAMDDMYQFMWDVTALEYAVSMHTKRGELSRKKKALDTISQLEINTNNNEEILREARSSRRNAFLRYLSSVFL